MGHQAAFARCPSEIGFLLAARASRGLRRGVRCYSTKTTKTTITAMTNAAIAMVRVSMPSSLPFIVLARADAMTASSRPPRARH